MNSQSSKINEFLLQTYNGLLNQYGHQNWWPSDSHFETAIGAILTQNTAWTNVEKAITNLKKENLLSPTAILDADLELLRQLIRPSGYFNQKSIRLKNLANWWLENASKIQSTGNMAEWRKSLLKVNGIGPETADCILLYCFEFPSFVIDAYTRRMFSKSIILQKIFTPEILEKWKYHHWQELFMNHLPATTQLMNEYHALIVRHCKEIKKFQPW